MKQKFKEAYMDTAIRFAELGHAVRLKVGAIIVKDDRIISIGFNGTPSGWDNNCEDSISGYDERVMHDPLDNREWTYDSTTKMYSALKTKPEVLHAEMNAISKIAKTTESADGATMFVTHQPCMHCAKIIYQSGIAEVYYRTEYRDPSGTQFLEKCGIVVEKIEEREL